MPKIFVISCHVSTIPKSPPKIIRDKIKTDLRKIGFFLIKDIQLIFYVKM